MAASKARTLGMLVFPGFEMLDVFGPLQMFYTANKEGEELYKIITIGESAEVKSAGGPHILVDFQTGSSAIPKLDILCIPGGAGTRPLVADKDAKLLDWIRTISQSCEMVFTVCTGSALLAQTGLLDGMNATTNKRAFQWVQSMGPNVLWNPKARWVEDKRGSVDYWTSSGVSAGTDLALRIIEYHHGMKRAIAVSERCEYSWNSDSSDDPFAYEEKSS